MFPPRPPREETTNALTNLYRTRDDRWFMLVLLNERQWPGLAAAIGRPELATDARFATAEARRVNTAALLHVLDDVFSHKTLDEWRAILDAAGQTFGVVGTVAEIATDPQALAAGFLRPLADTGMMTVDSPFTLTGVEKMPVTVAPGFGAHNQEILLAAGYSEAEIAALRADGTIAGG